MNKIDYIAAHNGGIKMFAGGFNLKGWERPLRLLLIL